MNGDNTAAWKRANIRLAFFVECEIPTRDRVAPVAQRRSKDMSPFRPVGEVVGAGVVGSALGPVHGNLGVSFMNFVHHIR